MAATQAEIDNIVAHHITAAKPGQAARRRPSTRRSQTLSWFQLAKMRLTSLALMIQCEGCRPVAA